MRGGGPSAWDAGTKTPGSTASNGQHDPLNELSESCATVRFMANVALPMLPQCTYGGPSFKERCPEIFDSAGDPRDAGWFLKTEPDGEGIEFVTDMRCAGHPF